MAVEIGDEIPDLITVKCTDHHETLINGLWNFFQTKRGVDFEVQWGSGGARPIRAHRLVLDVFLSPEKLGPNPSDDHDALLEFLYKGEVTVRKERLESLLAVAKESDFKMLVDALHFVSGKSEPPPPPKPPRKRPRPRTVYRKWVARPIQIVAAAETTDLEGSGEKIDTLVEVGEGYEIMVETTEEAAAEDDVPKPFKCDVAGCDMAFTKRGILKIHSQTHVDGKPYQCKICGKTFSQYRYVNQHAKIHSGEKNFKCDICEKTFTAPNSLAVHKMIHTGEKPFACWCGNASFSRNAELQVHLRTHTGERRFKCQVCGKLCSTSSNLKTHSQIHLPKSERVKPPSASSEARRLRRVANIRNNGDERPFKCEVCGKGFATREIWKVHTMIHSTIKAFKCDVCGRAFSQMPYLRRHVKLHTGNTPHKCDICGHLFTAPNALAIHRRTHTGEKPFECCICGKRYGRKTDLVVHNRTHTGERPFACYCGKAFARKEDFKIHNRIHTGEKPYQCDICEKRFTIRANLKHHAKTHGHRIENQLATTALESALAQSVE